MMRTPAHDQVLHATAGSAVVRGYVPGAWDMLHVGHLNILLRARELCDYLIVGVATDESLLAVKGRLPLVSMAERMEMVSAIDVVDEVIDDHGGNKRDVWLRRPFDVLFKGDDWKGTVKGDQLEQDMRMIGVELRYFPYTMHTSSTKLRELIGGRA